MPDEPAPKPPETPPTRKWSADDILACCDHAVLHPTLTDDQIDRELDAIRELRIASVCIKPYAVAAAARRLAETSIAVGTVIGFPHGSAKPSVKAFEAAAAFADGATEIDMVINIGKALSHDWAYCREDIRAVLDVVRTRHGVLKVIFETDYLTDETAKARLCELCSELRVDFVKTSTGFGFARQSDGSFAARGAQESDVRLMRRLCAPQVGVKASGGIRTLADARRFLELGATRLGTTATLAIWREAAGPDRPVTPPDVTGSDKTSSPY